MTPKHAPRIMFVDLADRPGSDRTVAGMARLGAQCAVLGPARGFAARSRYAATTFWLPARGKGWVGRWLLRSRLDKVVRDWRPDLLVPLDGEAARALRDPRLADADPMLRALIMASMGSPETVALLSDPAGLLASAQSLGLSTWQGATRTAAPDLVRMVACAKGHVLDGVSFRLAAIDPRSGDGTVLHAIERTDMDAAADTLVAALGCTGLLALRFDLAGDVAALVSVEEGAPVGGQIGRLFGHDIHEALLDHLRGRPAPLPRPLAPWPATIVLFPNELDRDPASRALNVPYALHDLPWDDLAMMEIYATWLHRRHRGSARHLRRHLPGEGTPSALDLRKLVASLDRYP